MTRSLLGVAIILLGAPAAVAGTPLPAPNPARVATAAPAVVVAGAPVPLRRPSRANIVGRVVEGRAVPVTAFAASNTPRVDALFAAANAAASGLGVATPAPERAKVPAASGDPFRRYGSVRGNLAGALDALRRDRYEEVFRRRNGLKDPIDRMTVDYFVLRAGPPELTSAMVAHIAARGRAWPSQSLMRTRYEEALSRERPSARAALKALSGSAQSAPGLRLLAKAQRDAGDRAALKTVRTAWHGKSLGKRMQAAFLKDFGRTLNEGDHLTRIDHLVGEGDFAEARALAPSLSAAGRTYVSARLAAAEGADNALARLSSVSATLKRRPGFALAKAEAERHRDKFKAAARTLLAVSPKRVVNGDAFWVEARIVARSLAERGALSTAQKLAEKGFARSPKDRADQAFHAGWFALQRKDAARAGRHFKALGAIATTPLSRSRAAYWQGRAAKARGAGARQHFEAAARFGATYYGQLARAELGRSGTGIGRAPSATSADRRAFAKNPVAVALSRTVAAGHSHRIWPLLKHIGATAKTPGEVALAVAVAERAGKAHLALMTAKEADRRGLNVGALAHPTRAIPKGAKVPAGLDKAIVYAIARQESHFNTGAVSPAGAAGLMQLMPKTAAAMARQLGRRHSQRMLTRDPAHNATLGAAYLKKRLDEYGGSYILTFAAYNAGASRVAEWIERFGDPRRRTVDPIDWVEQIPYPETRNYVQRVMENVQVYRERLGTGRLAIGKDLARGRVS
ncbi:MAG: lytic transglycosylase domain-containing protein [Pseudomonadota bacterium]